MVRVAAALRKAAAVAIKRNNSEKAKESSGQNNLQKNDRPITISDGLFIIY